jgi:UDPglucose--hexose-1-phosphate uridylyltransferase
MKPELHVLELRKPDGRSLKLYGRSPVSSTGGAPSPKGGPVALHSQLRWHPLRGEWVAYASHRQDRTFLPPKEFNPLRPSAATDHPTELPTGQYEVAVFDNLFPTFHRGPGAGFHDDITSPQEAYGHCEVVVFSQDPAASLAGLPLSQIDLILEVIGERTREIARDPAIKYVMPFENHGVEMGVTLHHPHGQIYSYPVIPPVPARENEQQRAFFEKQGGRALLGEMVAAEIAGDARTVARNDRAAAFVPACARYPYEVWVMPRRTVGLLHELSTEERGDLALVLQTVLKKYEALWNRPMPYLLVVHQAPVNSGPQPWFHLHIEITPPRRSPDRLKYLAGTELGAGLFANDCIPEESARLLREAKT